MSQLTELTDFLIANMPRRAMQGFDSQMDEIAFIPAQRDTGLGQYWESLGGSWGGRFKSRPDGNHFSLEHDGVR